MDELNELPEDLARAIDRLDARAERRAARVDAERVSAAVLKRLREEPDLTVSPRFGVAQLVRVAAGLAIVVTAGVVGSRLVHRQSPDYLPVMDARTARTLTTVRADSLLKAVDHIQVLNATVPVTSASVEELNTQQLRALLQAMQSSEEGTE